MQVVPSSVVATARAWAEQHLELSAAAGQVGSAPTTGFTPAVSGAAARFAAAWRRHLSVVAQDAEAQADGLRAAVADYLTTDGAVGTSVLGLRGQVSGPR